MVAQVGALLDYIATRRMAWWVWPLVLLAMAAVSDGLALFFQPLGAEWVALPDGRRFGETCIMITQAGQPCPQCGMTRAWVHAARLNLIPAFLYSPPGLALFLWINAGGVVGAIRLVTGNPRRLEPPAFLLMGWTLFWLIPLYMGTWFARIAGINPLP